MESLPALLVFVACGYLIGSLPFAVIVSRAFGLADPRGFGSGNPGATNVLRTGNRLAALLTLLGDAAKGWAAMWLVSLAGADDTAIALSGLAAFLGHLFPVFLRFRGGKGVATALGVLIGLEPAVALGAAITWAVTAALTRYSSLAALAAACVAPAIAFMLYETDIVSVVIGCMCILLIARHRPNILRLFAGTESRIGKRK